MELEPIQAIVIEDQYFDSLHEYTNQLENVTFVRKKNDSHSSAISNLNDARITLSEKREEIDIIIGDMYFPEEENKKSPNTIDNAISFSQVVYEGEYTPYVVCTSSFHHDNQNESKRFSGWNAYNTKSHDKFPKNMWLMTGNIIENSHEKSSFREENENPSKNWQTAFRKTILAHALQFTDHESQKEVVQEIDNLLGNLKNKLQDGDRGDLGEKFRVLGVYWFKHSKFRDVRLKNKKY